jgi:hypothetical protein
MLTLGGSDENYEPITFASEMELRDYFAGLAMRFVDFNTGKHDKLCAKRAYEIADSMMKARDK